MHCLYPITIRNPKWNTASLVEPFSIQVPCGRCIACQERRRSSWAFRMYQEASLSADLTLFLTLTYSDEFVPKTEQGHLTLDRTALQKFMKRLRKNVYNRVSKESKFSFRYFGCGEYGSSEDATHRPHYHLILFCKDASKVVDFFAVRELVESAWQFGFTSVSPCPPTSESSINRFRYVAKYVCKVGFSEDQDIDDQVVKPFALMSLKPGIGAEYLSDDILRYIMENDDFGEYIGKEAIPLPRYYVDQLPESLRRSHSKDVKNKLWLEHDRKVENNLHFTSVDFQSLQADIAYEQFKLKQLKSHYGKVYRKKIE